MFFVKKFKVASSLLLLFAISILYCTATDINSQSSSTHVDLDNAPNFSKEYCSCLKDWQCECCAKVDDELRDIHHTLCSNLTIVPNTWTMHTNLRLNENIIYANTFPIVNSPSLCSPLWPIKTLKGCVSLHNILFHQNKSIHCCMNLSVSHISVNVIDWQIGCVDVGLGGIQIVDPSHPKDSATRPLAGEWEMNHATSFIAPKTQNMEFHDYFINIPSAVR